MVKSKWMQEGKQTVFFFNIMLSGNVQKSKVCACMEDKPM